MIDTPKQQQAEPPANVQGQGSGTAVIEELNARITKLEAGPAAPQPQRMVPLGGGFLDQQGNPVMVPAPIESLGDRLVRQEFENRVRATQPEREPENEPYEPDPNFVPPSTAKPADWAFAVRGRGELVDTRTGQLTRGMETDTRTLQHIDRIAAYPATLERIEAQRRHEAAFGKASYEGGDDQ